ncbi:hypothetical protein [Burkholderia sp. Ac-20384]|uniref:hypothetical protein n=1 Tax=Burkholderia sp. Ac-20384 TaxID=2703902 RepID=UPI001F11F613|nr:hypothetical protein [Burkholderia sp. Ac-20384]
MKKLLFIAAMLTSSTAFADDAYVYPFAGMKVGEATTSEFPTILYTSRKCELPLTNAANMRRYESYRGVWDIGCWGETIDGNAVIVVSNTPTKSIALNSLARADVDSYINWAKITVKALPSYGL